MTRHPNHRPAASLAPELRRTTVPGLVRAWVRRETGAAVVRVRRLQGASSAAVHALLLDDGRRVVLRRYVWSGFIESEPEAPGREVDALRFASARSLPVPSVLAADVDGSSIGDAVPALLMSMVRGAPDAVPDLDELAATAASVHAVDARGLGHQYFRWYDRDTDAVPPNATQPALWARAIDTWREPIPTHTDALVHRDFHPGNVLWARGAVTGIVDWANACSGPVGCDVAHCRANLIDLAGWDEADAFQRAHERLTGVEHHPWFEVASVLENDVHRLSASWIAVAEERLGRALASLG